MKKKIFIVFALVAIFVTAILITSCSSEKKKYVLNVYNWGEYISDGSEDSLDVNAEFEKYCKDELGLDVEVNYTTYESNESMYNKLKIGAVSYDLVIPSDYMVQRLIKEGMLEKLDYENIPNFQYINDRHKYQGYDPTQEYSVPYFVGYVGIIYNNKIRDMEGFEESDLGGWDLLWNEKYEGKILQFNNARDALGTAMFKNGIDVNTTDEALWRKALNDLKKQKPLLQAYVMDEIFNKMQNGSAWIAPYYAGDYLTMLDVNEDLSFYFPEGATNVFADAMCIPKGAPNKWLAEKYINFMLREDIAVENAAWVCYSSPNDLVNNSDLYWEYMGEDAKEILNPSFEEGYVTQYYDNLDEETLVLVNSLWEEVKTESGGTSNTGVYVTCVVIVAAIATVLGIRFYIQHKRRKYY